MSIFDTGLNPLKNSKVVPIFLCINSAYAPYASTAINSLVKHANPKRYYRVIILHDGLNLANRTRLRNLVSKNVAIQFKKITNSLHLKILVRYCSRKKGAGDFFSSAVYYYRFFIPSLFLKYNKCVYIDSDTVLLGDIGELFDTELGDNYIAAMVDPKVSSVPEFKDYVEKCLDIPAKQYTNSGVLVMDTKGLRKIHYLQTMIDLISKYDADLVAPDQDYMNTILRGHIKHLSKYWNMEPLEKMPKEARLIHFNLFNKPWHYQNVPGEKYFWNAARGTGFYGDLKRQQKNFDAKKQKEDHAKIGALIKKAAKLAKTKSPLTNYKAK